MSTNTDLVNGQQVELLHLSIPHSGLKVKRKLQVKDKLTFREHPLLVLVGVAGRSLTSAYFTDFQEVCLLACCY